MSRKNEIERRDGLYPRTCSLGSALQEKLKGMEKNGRRAEKARRGRLGQKDGAQKAIAETRHGPNVQLAAFWLGQVEFLWRSPCKVPSFACSVTSQKGSASVKSTARFAKGK